MLLNNLKYCLQRHINSQSCYRSTTFSKKYNVFNLQIIIFHQDEELSKPATSLYTHNLAGILETAIRATNTQYEDPDILERLDVRLLDIQPGDNGWDVFSLDYKVQVTFDVNLELKSCT